MQLNLSHWFTQLAMTSTSTSLPKTSHSPIKSPRIELRRVTDYQLTGADFIGLDELLTQLNLHEDQLPKLDSSQKFSFKTTRHFASKIQLANPQDPLLRQILPLAEESLTEAGYHPDPLQEAQFNVLPGLIHKYPSRVLLTATGACAIHCRYCFRRHFDYQANLPTGERLNQIKTYIKSQPKVSEVILSGGDPLVLTDSALTELLRLVESIDQIKTLRFHSRLPLLKPERLDSPFFELLSQSRLESVLVIHANHPNELDAHTSQALLRVKPKLSALLNQSVLLKGVNDTTSTLAALSEKLFQAGVLPYYLHLLDPVQGAQHFDIPEYVASQVFAELQKTLPGYLIPRLVRENPSQMHKTLVI